ncbi:MAG TPA: hypothetical protein VH143_21320 [Kofleriaceae bacterium]|jgi:hypothetical protein|nr:hypothetical protein [Kofleriaceae bacterium]
MAVHPDDLAFRDAPGTLPTWACIAIALACFATVLLPAVGGHVLWSQVVNTSVFSAGAIEYGVALLAAIALAVAAIPQLRISRGLQVAVLLPAIHVGLIAIGWVLWRRCVPNVVDPDGWFVIGVRTSLFGAAFGLAAIGYVAARVIARRRRDVHWSNAFALYGLALLFAFGLWLPFASAIAADRFDFPTDPRELVPIRLVAWVVATPTVVAVAYTAIAIRWPDFVNRWRALIAGKLAIVIMIAIYLRGNATVADALTFANFIPILLAAALVACGGLALQVALTAVRERSLRRRLEHGVRATVACDGGEPVVGALEIAGWLRAPRTVVRPFTIATPEGELPIPGARLATAIAPATTILSVGEAMPIISVGDVVVIAGLERRDTGEPFRAHAGLTPGEDIAIARADLPPASAADVAFATWRPTLAYLAILVAISLPALAAELSSALR